MRFGRFPLAGFCALALAACGEAGSDLQSDVGDLAKSASQFASETVDTKTACTLAGQEEVFCGCVQAKLGVKIAPEELQALTEAIARAVSAGTVEVAAKEGAGVDPKIRDALVQCAVSNATGEGSSGVDASGGGASTKAP